MELLNNIFIFTTHLFTLSPIVAFIGAFIWGILSIVLSPCHLSSIPLAIGFINGKGAISHKRALQLSFLFSVGILFSIGVIGGITWLLGRMLGDIGVMGIIIVGLIFIIIGLWLLDLVNLPFPAIAQPHIKQKGHKRTALLLGIIFGLALGPCSFGFMMPLLAVVFQLAATKIWLSLALILAFGLGHISIIIFAGTFTNAIQIFLKWDNQSHSTKILRKICGILVGLAGIYLIISIILK
ncbi:MAG: cytochrome c biogenesis protein CcdA [Candidatus Margulisiibacteriota bacterium]|jgi:cytochrome c-type biogenesis protein